MCLLCAHGHSFLRGEALLEEENAPIIIPNDQSTVLLKGREGADLIG